MDKSPNQKRGNGRQGNASKNSSNASNSSKNNQNQSSNYNPKDHPRDEEGRFTEK